MKYINDFNTHSSLNESKEKRAERKKKQAEELVNGIEKALQEGDKNKAEILMKKAAKKIDRAEVLDSNVDTDNIKNKIENLKFELEKPLDDEFKIKSREHRDKIKISDFEIINKIKIKGDEVSNDELQLFLKTVKNYLNEYAYELKSGKNIPKEYDSPYTDFKLEVKSKDLGVLGRRIVFLYKEDINDKIKLILSEKDLNNIDTIKKEIDDVLDSEDIKYEIEKHYVEDKDRIKTEPSISITDYQSPSETITKTEKEINILSDIMTDKNDSFINNGVKLLINEKLNLSSKNTDEDKIFNFFVKENPEKTISKENINEILIQYRKKKSLMNEDFDILGGAKRASQSILDTETKGVVGDLMWAFNTDAKTVSNDMNILLQKISVAFENELIKAGNKIENSSIKENFDISSILGGVLLGGYALKKSPALSRLVGITKSSSLTSPKGNVVKGGLRILPRLGGLLLNPWVWIGLAVLASIGGGFYLWGSFDEQQKKLAHIFLMMRASGSEEFINEINRNGIVIKVPNIDLDKLGSVLSKGEVKESIKKFNEF